MKVTPRPTQNKPKKPIGTIAEERAACIAAFRKYPKATHAWCIHHGELVEPISHHGFMDRVRFIWTAKSHSEKAVRYRNFRPCLSEARSRAALNRQWPNNTWNGQSIF